MPGGTSPVSNVANLSRTLLGQLCKIRTANSQFIALVMHLLYDLAIANLQVGLCLGSFPCGSC